MIQELIKDTQDKMDNTLKTLDHQLSGIRTGKASPALVENISVLYYGAPTRMRDLANISTPEARLLVISPYDPTVIGEIERSILAANIGVTPVSMRVSCAARANAVGCTAGVCVSSMLGG